MENDRTVYTRPVVSEYGPVRRRVTRYQKVLGIGLVLMLVVVAFVGLRLVLEERAEAERLDKLNSAEQRLRTFAEAWTSGQPTAAARVTDSPREAESLLASVSRNLKPRDFRIHVGEGRIEETAGQEGVVIPFTVRMQVPRVGRLEYASTARLVRPSREQLRTSGTTSDGQPVIQFTPAVVHPQLKKGQTLAVAKTSERGEIRDRNGDVLTAPSLVGQVDESTGRGTSGLQKRYDEQLRGTGPAYAVALTDRDTGEAVKPLVAPGTKAGRDVRTTIDPKVQRAAADALQGTDKPASLVALRPSNGDVLAVANRPGGFNRALVGQYPPGSTFKVVSAAALLSQGLRPSDALPCPKYAWVNGYRFANQDEFALSSGSTFREAFARSCNTAFVEARDRIDDDTLAETAAAFGIGGQWDIGASTYDGSIPANTDDTDKAAAMIGQGRNLASPLVMASVAATVKSGRFVQPRLVPEAIEKPHEAPTKLDPRVVRDLRSMMRAVVTHGAGDALRDVPGGPHAKTGTAEFGNEKPPRTHAWMIGYQQDADLAWAVLIEDGGSGGKDAGPIAADFLKRLND